MAITILHTADWHLGQHFYGFDRNDEHRHALQYIQTILQQREIDALIVSGDIFDVGNPSADSISMFYTFLQQCSAIRPTMQIIVIAGNHDSPARLESPKPLIADSNINIVGILQKNENGEINIRDAIIPIKNASGEVECSCLAIPFLRHSDVPVGSGLSYSEFVCSVYRKAVEEAKYNQDSKHSILAMGHLHAVNAEITDDDKHERIIVGGAEGIPIAMFADEVAYIALGHIHKAQMIGGKEHVRYSGSPIPMSFSELHYRHSVAIATIENNKCTSLETIEIPPLIPFVSVPKKFKPYTEGLEELQMLPDIDTAEIKYAPYLEFRALLDIPLPGLRHEIEQILKNKYVRLVKINVQYNKNNDTSAEVQETKQTNLNDMNPVDIFHKYFQKEFSAAPPEEITELFQWALTHCDEEENIS